jgi:N-acetylneuraminate lyase
MSVGKRVELATFFPHGLLPAVHTPFHEDGTLNLDAVERQADWLMGRDVSGVFVAGTTGECHSLSFEERRQLARRWCEVARGTPLRVIVHVGHCNQRESIQLAQDAARCGAHAIAAMSPFYHRPETAKQLVTFLSPIAAAAQLPFYYYDIPHLTKVKIPVNEVIEYALDHIPQFAGIKYTNCDLMVFQKCVRLSAGRLGLWHGLDETLVAGVVLGATGAVGTTYNFAARWYRRILDTLAAYDWVEARRMQQRSVAMIETLSRYGFASAAKAVMELCGVPCGPPRPPLQPLDADAKRQLFNHLETLQVLDIHQ